MSQSYDVFLSHSSADKPAVETLARKLREAGLEPFLDKWHLIPGDPWQEALEEALDASRTCAVFLGPKGLGAWQNEEMRSALETRVSDRTFRVIPVLLPGSFEPRKEDLPRFLRRLTWVDFREGLDDADAFHRLLGGIRGKAPGPGSGGGGGGPAKSNSSYRCMAQEPEEWVPRSEYGQVLEALCSKAGAQAGRSVGITTALRGAGGFGKTALARKLCFDPEVREAYPDGILWATMGEEADSSSRLREIRDLLRWWTGEEPPAFETVTGAGAKLRESLSRARALVVVDDVWSPDDVAPFQGLGEACALLFTTRDSRTLPRDSTFIKVDAMASSEAVDLLRAGLPASSPEDFRPLAARLGEWPLLLKLVNGPLREMVKEGLSISEALQEIEGALVAEGYSAFDQNDSASRHAAASRAILVSVRRLPEAEQDFFFQLAIFPEDEGIPVSVLERYWGTSHFSATRICQRFYDLSLLLGFDRKNGTIRLHDVTRRVLMEQKPGEPSALHFRLLEAYRPASGNWEDLPRKETYIWRRLRDHFVGAGDGHEFRVLLAKFSFIEAKLQATDINSLIGDYEPFALENEELRLVQSALRLSSHVLANDRAQLTSQLFSRLLGQREADLQAFLEEAQSWQEGIWLRPRTRSLTQAGGALVRTLEGHAAEVTAVAVLDGGRAVSGSADGALRVWDLESGHTLKVLALGGRTARVTAVAVLDGGRAVSGSADGMLRVWDLESGQTLKALEGHTDWIRAVAVLDGHRIVSGSTDGTLRVWDLESGQTLQILREQWSVVSAMVVLDDHRIVSGFTDGTLRMWDLDSDQTLRILREQWSVVSAMAVLDGHRIVSGSADGTLRVWDIESTQILQTLEGHTSWVNAVALLDGRRIISGSSDRTLIAWDLEDRQPLRTLEGYGDWFRAVAVLDSGRVISGSSDGTLRVWNLESGQTLQTFKAHTSRVSAVAALDYRRAISGSADGTLQVWDLESGQTIQTLKGHMAEVSAVVALGSRCAISGSTDGTLRVWSLESGQILQTLKGQVAEVSAVAALDYRRAISGSADGTLRVWHLESGQTLQALKGHIAKVSAVVVLSGGRAISGSDDGTLRVWDLERGETLQTLQGHTAGIRGVALLDGGRVVSGSDDGTLRLWDLETGQILQTLQGHTAGVRAVVVLNGGRAVSGSNDRTLRVWDLESGEVLAVMTVDAPVLTVAISPGGNIIVAGDQSGRVHFFDLVEPEPSPEGAWA